ncbi:hypothetical protein N7495_006737 [Penicillium taxi]|uniref:uncharacterized protein n=1 Tax=Penicillium taxi TaxID=168475 RepID=UPI0025455A5B|nr:uncharacterized protein N7495_006737 [Penicillium taxi]KAJ5895046.1 hypothetical protein N7495_006737 [Penicillium taxi]
MAGPSIRPDDLESFNVMGRQTGTERELSGREFLTHCPPDIPPHHRILALLTITDVKNIASPAHKSDVWIVSDFYLSTTYFPLAFPPLWMTCEDPSRLVDKYTEYAHGERRVVLDAGMLPKIDVAQNIRVVSRENLSERYLGTLREQAQEAAVNGEHLIILIFGHGTTTYEVATCYCPVTLFITSCYSYGWLLNPDINVRFMNATSVAAADDFGESSSWSASGSVGRIGGMARSSSHLAL